MSEKSDRGTVTQLHQYGKGGFEGTRKKIQLAIVRGEEFKSGALRGERGVAVTHGQLPSDWSAVLRDGGENVDYVVYSYATPIAWHWRDQVGWIIPNVSYSNTTTRHQGFVKVALALAGPIETLNDERLR